MDFHSIRPVKFDQHLKPLTGIQCNRNGFGRLNLVVELGGNPLRLCLVKLGGNPPYSTKFDQQAYNVISIDFHPIRPVEFDWQAYNVISIDFHPI